MTEPELHLISSILEVKPSGIDNATADILLPDGKSIAELLDDQEKTKNNTNIDQ